MSKQDKGNCIEYVMNNIIKSRIMDVAETIRRENTKNINSDVIGSYTGMSSDNEQPTQDADDL